MPDRAQPLRKDIPSALLFIGVISVVVAAVCAAGNSGPAGSDYSRAAAVSPSSSTGVQTPLSANPQGGDRKAATQSAIPVTVNAGNKRPTSAKAGLPIRFKLSQIRVVHRVGPNLAYQRQLNGERGEREAVSKKNLTKLAAAMHDYHQRHSHFPPAVLLGADGKTPHSWRVELLPYLDQKALYDQYRMDEPWDSKNNLEVLNQMPAIYRSPYDNSDACNAGYFAVVGAGTAFEGSKGISIREITDGTSNTLLLAECRRTTPWTKPDDILFDPSESLPELG
jgi:hypothetical protein